MTSGLVSGIDQASSEVINHQGLWESDSQDRPLSDAKTRKDGNDFSPTNLAMLNEEPSLQPGEYQHLYPDRERLHHRRIGNPVDHLLPP